MSGAILPKSRTEADRESFALDINSEVARRVIDSETHNKLDDVVNALPPITQETLQFSGSIGLTATSFPSVAGDDIIQVIVSCKVQSPASRRLLVSFDNGSTFFTLSPGSMLGWEPKDLQQIQIKGNAASVDYDIVINRKI